MPRAYDVSGREQSAQDTRRRIVAVARDLLLAGGYAQMRVADLARAADVSPQTVYNAVGGKAEVVKAVYDLLLAGDDDAVPMSRRPGFRRVTGAADVAGFADAYAAWTRGIYDRVGPLLGVLVEHGSGGDPLLGELVATTDRERRLGNTHALSGLAERVRLPTGRARTRLLDQVWTLTSPAVYDSLVRGCRWSPAAYERWLATHLRVALAP